MYEVSVQLDIESNILTSYCDCPFDFGPDCKHELSVYYALIDRLK
ncbi:SWIM zinc finger family protein, partial [Escherichia coli]